MSGKKVKNQINDVSAILEIIMRENLTIIGQNIIDKLVSAVKTSSTSEAYKAINENNAKGVAAYKAAMRTALTIASGEGLAQAMVEVPNAKNLKDFKQLSKIMNVGNVEDLPLKAKNYIKAQSDLLVTKNVNDLESTINFQYLDSFRSIDSVKILEQDLITKMSEFITGPALSSGATITSAKVINEARNSFFFDKTVLEEIEAFEFFNNDPISKICQFLSGKVISKFDPLFFRVTPPLHWNCKSTILPILSGNLKGREIWKIAIPPTLEKAIQFAENSCECCTDQKILLFDVKMVDHITLS